MSLEDRRITGYRVSIADLPDKVEGRAQWLKEQFDARTDEEVKSSINGMVDDLRAPAGAAEVGAELPAGITPVPELAPGETVKVQHVLGGLKKYTDDKVTEIGGADMQKAVYDPDGSVQAAGGIQANLEARTMTKTEYAPDATATITGGVLAVTSLFPHPQTEYDVRFTMPAGAFTSVSIDGVAMTGVFDTTGGAADFEPAPGVPVTLTRQGDRAFFKTSGVNKANVGLFNLSIAYEEIFSGTVAHGNDFTITRDLNITDCLFVSTNGANNDTAMLFWDPVNERWNGSCTSAASSAQRFSNPRITPSEVLENGQTGNTFSYYCYGVNRNHDTGAISRITPNLTKVYLVKYRQQ